MAMPAQVDLFDHDGPWSEQDFLALPEDRRIELLDGELLVSPAPGRPHQRLSFRLAVALDAAAPEGFEVLEAINVRVAPGKILIPDVVVATNPGADLVVTDAADVAMVAEIVSPGSVSTDRAVKPHLYAAAGIVSYLRVELDPAGLAAVAYRLQGGRYREIARGERIQLVEPFRCELDLNALAATGGPS